MNTTALLSVPDSFLLREGACLCFCDGGGGGGLGRQWQWQWRGEGEREANQTPTREGHYNTEQFYQDYVRLRVVKQFLSLSAHCAAAHEHKTCQQMMTKRKKSRWGGKKTDDGRRRNAFIAFVRFFPPFARSLARWAIPAIIHCD